MSSLNRAGSMAPRVSHVLRCVSNSPLLFPATFPPYKRPYLQALNSKMSRDKLVSRDLVALTSQPQKPRLLMQVRYLLGRLVCLEGGRALVRDSTLPSTESVAAQCLDVACRVRLLNGVNGLLAPRAHPLNKPGQGLLLPIVRRNSLSKSPALVDREVR